ncbi:hypothetical protein CJO81_07005 [Ralstonia solanacearum]|nr:hypothetical protein CJO81_07005 [Ralstonia solanacearum]AXW28027.1 hypothetical protein CJO87_07005 [Ralstonia solanacearum]
MRLCFYGGLNVYVSLMPEGAAMPTNIGMEFVSRGIPTVITLGDEKFVFNDDGSAGLLGSLRGMKDSFV